MLRPFQRRAHFLSLALITLGNSILASAIEFVRPLDPQDYFEGAPHTSTLVEHAQRVQGVRVAWVNFEALRRDFPAIASLSEQQIRDWLIQNFAYIGSQQHRLNGLRNSAIPTVTGDTRIAIRPRGWLRSAAIEAIAPNGSPMGMVDMKGIGHGAMSNQSSRLEQQVESFQLYAEQPEELDRIRIADHSDGLMSLGEAIAEVTRQQATQLLFNESGLSLETVESYAILALPFDILKDRGQQIPAALYLRQANLGRESGLEVPASILLDNHGGRQQTQTGTMVDFGGVVLQDSRVQAQFGPFSATNAQATRPWIWGHETAIAFAKNGDLEAVSRHIGEMLAPLKNEGSIQAAQERHRLLEQELLSMLHQQRHLSYTERARVFRNERQKKISRYEDVVVSIDQARVVLTNQHGDFVTQQAQQAIGWLISQNSARAFECLKEEFSRASFGLKFVILRQLKFNSESPFYAQFSREMYELVRDAYLGYTDIAFYDSSVKLEAIQVLLNLLESLRDRDPSSSLTRTIEDLLERVSGLSHVRVLLQGIKGQISPWATRVLLKALQSPRSDIHELSLTFASYSNDPEVVRWVEQHYEHRDDLPHELISAIKESHNSLYHSFFQRRLRRLITLPSVPVSTITDTLSVLSLWSASPGTDSSQVILDVMPRLDPVELFETLVNFRGRATLDLLYTVRDQAQTLRGQVIGIVVERGLSHLLGQQNHLEALELIRVLMMSADTITAAQAVRALGNYSDLRSAQMLERELHIPEKHHTHSVAIQSLLERTDSHARRTFESALNHEDVEIRSFVARNQAAHYLRHLPSRCNRLLTD